MEAVGRRRRKSSMVKIERILCPMDSTPESVEALRFAVALARVYGARLLLCHCGRGAAAAAVAGGGGAQGRFQRILEAALAPHLATNDLARLDWEGFVVGGDAPGMSIAREAGVRQADLIVMRSRRRRYGAALLGSTAEAVCRTAPCSVLVTHPRERERVGLSAGRLRLGRVLVAHDFSDRSELALQHGVSLARKSGAGLHLLHVLPEPEREVPGLWAAGAAQSLYHTSLRKLQEAVPSDLVRAGALRHAVLTGRPYEKILSYAAENEIDLVCIGADGVDQRPPALFGSNVDRVLRQSPCPVLVARQFKPAVAQATQSL